jgi:hypothetical protein
MRKRPLGRPRLRWEDNIKIDLQEVGWEGIYWIDLVQDRERWRLLVNAVMNLRVLIQGTLYLKVNIFNIWHIVVLSSQQVWWTQSYWILNTVFLNIKIRLCLWAFIFDYNSARRYIFPCNLPTLWNSLPVGRCVCHRLFCCVMQYACSFVAWQCIVIGHFIFVIGLYIASDVKMKH